MGASIPGIEKDRGEVPEVGSRSPLESAKRREAAEQAGSCRLCRPRDDNGHVEEPLEGFEQETNVICLYL